MWSSITALLLAGMWLSAAATKALRPGAVRDAEPRSGSISPAARGRQTWGSQRWRPRWPSPSWYQSHDSWLLASVRRFSSPSRSSWREQCGGVQLVHAVASARSARTVSWRTLGRNGVLVALRCVCSKQPAGGAGHRSGGSGGTLLRRGRRDRCAPERAEIGPRPCRGRCRGGSGAWWDADRSAAGPGPGLHPPNDGRSAGVAPRPPRRWAHRIPVVHRFHLWDLSPRAGQGGASSSGHRRPGIAHAHLRRQSDGQCGHGRGTRDRHAYARGFRSRRRLRGTGDPRDRCRHA